MNCIADYAAAPSPPRIQLAGEPTCDCGIDPQPTNGPQPTNKPPVTNDPGDPGDPGTGKITIMYVMIHVELFSSSLKKGNN